MMILYDEFFSNLYPNIFSPFLLTKGSTRNLYPGLTVTIVSFGLCPMPEVL